MNVQENVCFVSKLRYLNIQKSPGYTVHKPTPGGGTVAVQEVPEFVKFKNHRVVTNSPDIIEFLRKVVKERPQLGIREIREKTKQELYDDQVAKVKENLARLEQMKNELPPTEEEKEEQKEEIIKSAEGAVTPKVMEKPFGCWLGKCSMTFTSIEGLQRHLTATHNKKMKKVSIIRKLKELAKEESADMQVSE